MDLNLKRRRQNSPNKEEFYAKKPRFRRRLIEKYSTSRYNLNTKLTNGSSLKRIHNTKVKLKREFLSNHAKSNPKFFGHSKLEGGDAVAENSNSSSNISDENPKPCSNLDLQDTISAGGHSNKSCIGQSQKWKIINLDFYSYLADRVAENENKPSDKNSNVKKKKRKRGHKNKLAKKEENREGTYVSHDPYFDSWIDLGEAKVEEKIGLFTRLGVNQPLFPLVHRNIVTMCGRKDSEITDTWAEFSLSTLITEDCDSDVKQVLLPVVDPLLLRAVEDFNDKWSTQFSDVEIVKRPWTKPKVCRSRTKEIKSGNVDCKVSALKSEPRSNANIEEKTTKLTTGNVPISPTRPKSLRERKKRILPNEIPSSLHSESAKIDSKIPAIKAESLSNADTEEKIKNLANRNVPISPPRTKSLRERKKPLHPDEVLHSAANSPKCDCGTKDEVSSPAEVPDWDAVAEKCGFKPCWVAVNPLRWQYDKDLGHLFNGGYIKSKWFDDVADGKIPEESQPAGSGRVSSSNSQPGAEDADEVHCAADHIFGYQHSSRTYGMVLDYRFRNESFVYAYKMRRILKFQHKNNKFFKSSSYCRIRPVETGDEDIFVDVLTEEVQTVGSKSLMSVKEEGAAGSSTQIALPSPFKNAENPIQTHNSFSSNPLEMFTFPRRDLFGLSVIKNVDALTTVEQKIQFVDGALLKRKMNCKWLVVELTKNIELMLFKTVSILPAKLIFEVMYRADLTKKLVCTKINDDSCDKLLQFGIYGIPGICNAVLFGPYSVNQLSPKLEAPTQLYDGTIKYVDVLEELDNISFPSKHCDSVQAFWWHPKTPTVGIKNNAAYLNFLFSSPVDVEPPIGKERIYVRDLMSTHLPKTYLSYQGGKTQLFNNYVLIHDLMETNLMSRKMPDESQSRSAKRSVRFVPSVSSLNHENSVASTGCDKEKSSIARLKHLRGRSEIIAQNERQRRTEFAFHKEHLRSIHNQGDDLPLNSILAETKNMIKSMTVLDQHFTDQKVELKWIRLNLLGKYLKLLEQGGHSNAQQLYSLRRKFLQSLDLPDRAELIEKERGLREKIPNHSVDRLDRAELIEKERELREKISNHVNSAALESEDVMSAPITLQKDSVRRVRTAATRFKNGNCKYVNLAPQPDSEGLPLPSIKSVRSVVIPRRPRTRRKRVAGAIGRPDGAMPSSSHFEVSQLNRLLQYKNGTPEAAYVDHSYSLKKSMATPREESQSPSSPLKNYSFKSCESSQLKEGSDRMLIYLLENEEPISKLQISRIKNVNDTRADLQGGGGSAGIKTSNLIQLLLETLKAKQRKADVQKPEEKTKLTHHLTILEKMLSGSKNSKCLDKSDSLEISADEENINLYTGDKKYSCRIIRSPPEFDYAETSPNDVIKKMPQQESNNAVPFREKITSVQTANYVEETVVQSTLLDTTESIIRTNGNASNTNSNNLLGKLSAKTSPPLGDSLAKKGLLRVIRQKPIILRKNASCQPKFVLKTIPVVRRNNYESILIKSPQKCVLENKIVPHTTTLYEGIQNVPVDEEPSFSFCWKKCTDEKADTKMKNDLEAIAVSPASTLSLDKLIQEETISDSGNESDLVPSRLLSVKSFANMESLNTRLYSNLVKLVNIE